MSIFNHLYVTLQDIYKDSIENSVAKVTDLPYFEGDFWPNVLEDIIKEQDQEEEEKRKREEAEAAAAEAEGSGGADDGEEPAVVVSRLSQMSHSQHWARLVFLYIINAS